jgi:hypothetical protein
MPLLSHISVASPIPHSAGAVGAPALIFLFALGPISAFGAHPPGPYRHGRVSQMSGVQNRVLLSRLRSAELSTALPAESRLP